jgi:hypothetical protein
LREYCGKGAAYTDNNARYINLSNKKAQNEFVRIKKRDSKIKNWKTKEIE